jgi:NAD(P)-dependent dehydrogenase (short-subunit alcohol dehydrogenase family)
MPRVAVVTGANRGLGLATARALARDGMTVVLTARTLQKAEAAGRGLHDEGLEVVPCEADVSDDASVAAMGQTVASRFGRCDVLVNNAGSTFEGHDWSDPSTSVFRTPTARVLQAIDTNTLGALRAAQALVPLMKANRYGRIVNVSTGMGQLSDMGGQFTAYRLSKVALNGLTRILHAETRSFGDLKVNAVCPGWVRTDMGGSRATRMVEEGIAGILWAARLPADGPSGGFFRDGHPIPW